MARKKHEAEKKHALRKKEALPVQDMPDETEHPALSEEKKPRVSKLLYRIIAALLIAVVLLIILENKDNLTPENIGDWIRTKAVGFRLWRRLSGGADRQHSACGQFRRG